jgi:MFS family permease
MQRIAFLWLVYSLTESATLVAIGVVSRQLAQVVLSPWAGLLADTLNRKNIIIVTQIIAVVVNVGAGLLIMGNMHTIGILIASELLLGLVNGLEQPVRQSFIYDITPDKKYLGNAIALHSTSINFSQMIGPLIAGFLIATFGEGACYLINSGMLVVFIVGMFLLKNIQQVGTKKIKRKEIVPDMVEGFKYAHKTLSVHYIMMATIIASGFGFAFTVLLPIMAADLFNGEAATLGYMHTALAVGSFVSTLFVAGKKGVNGWHELTFISAIAYGATVLLLGFVTGLWWALFILFVIGFAKAITFSSGKTALQITALEELQGRVSGCILCI